MDQSLHIKWSTEALHPPAKDWFDWSNTPTFCHDPLDFAFSWPAGTLEALRHAFMLKLPRSKGWVVERHPQKSSIEKAAEIFKRGVPLSTRSDTGTSGEYYIEFLDSWAPSKDSLVIIDQNVASLWDIKSDTSTFAFCIDEKSKTLESVASLKDLITKSEQSHSTTLTIVGGGVLADTASFCASLLNKKFILVPSTLLAMIDACVGGKTGVNFPPFGKNQLGRFAFPEKVIISKHWLRSLPQRQLQAGLSEAFKHALIQGDRSLANLAAMGTSNLDIFLEKLVSYVEVKKSIVEKDPMELGLRSVLNFGHTLAHALEAISHEVSDRNYIYHGEAVGFGMFFAVYLSHRLGYLNQEIFSEIFELIKSSCFLVSKEYLIEKLGTDFLTSPTLISKILSAIQQDKKNDSQTESRWVLLKDWGQFANCDDKFTISVKDHEFTTAYLDFIKLISD